MVGFFLLFCSNAVGPILIVSVVMVNATWSILTYLYLPRQGWMSEHFKTPEERGILIGLAVTFVFPMSAWMSSASVSIGGCQCSLLIMPTIVLFYPAKHAPVYPIGYKAPIGFSLACIMLTLVFRWLSARKQPPVALYETDDSLMIREDCSEKEKVNEADSKGDAPIVPTLNSVEPPSRS
jgi:hypothetical protein